MNVSRTIGTDEAEILRPQLAKWLDERLGQHTTEFIRREVRREEAALLQREIQINKRLFEIEVIVWALNYLDGNNDSETIDTKTDIARQCRLVLVKTTKGE